LYWDEREHTNSGNGWVGAHFNGSPRLHVSWLTRYRRDRSFPAIQRVDHAPLLAGTQPDPGDDVLPANGSPWGVWGGWFDWDDTTLEDSADRWGVTIVLRTGAPFANDNSPSTSARASVSVRRAQVFQAATGDKFFWTLSDAATGAWLRSGSLVVGANGLVTVPSLIYSTAARRLELMRVFNSDELESR